MAKEVKKEDQSQPKASKDTVPNMLSPEMAKVLAPDTMETLGGPSAGKPPASGPNLSKEESEFAATAETEPEKTPASQEPK